jgi:hypothetical protein
MTFTFCPTAAPALFSASISIDWSPVTQVLDEHPSQELFLGTETVANMP